MLDTETGEEKVVADGPTMTGVEVVEQDVRRMRSPERDLAFVRTFVLPGLTLNEEQVVALWHIVHRKPRNRRPARWRTSGTTDELERQLRAAVDGWLTERERDGRLTGRRWVHPIPRTLTHPASSPDHALDRKRALALRDLILARVQVRVREEGTERDRSILPLWQQRLPHSAIARDLGLKPQAVQAFERKLARWGREVFEALQIPVAKTGTSSK
jgi:hypothetical protein